MIEIDLNGKRQRLEAPLNLRDLLDHLQLTAAGIAVAVNGEVVPRSELEQRRVDDHDQVDIIHPVGGG